MYVPILIFWALGAALPIMAALFYSLGLKAGRGEKKASERAVDFDLCENNIKDFEQSSRFKRLNCILDNINAYNGTPEHQREVFK